MSVFDVFCFYYIVVPFYPWENTFQDHLGMPETGNSSKSSIHYAFFYIFIPTKKFNKAM
jgi:hypothetical protein